MIRLGLAGLGVHGARYAAHLLAGDVPGATLVAVSRADEIAGRAFATDHGLDFVADPLDLAARPGLDAVVAVLRPDLHPPFAEAALRAGRPVLVEKPLALDVASAARVAALARRAPAPLMVAQTLRFDPLIRRLREEIASIGRPHLVAINQRFEPTPRVWLDTPGPGGVILNTGIHGFDLLRFLTGAEPISISAEDARVVTRRTEDLFAAVIRMAPGDLVATIDNTRATLGRSGRIEIVGERGQLRADHVHRWLYRTVGREETALGPVAAVPTIVATLRAFVGCVRDGDPVPVTADDGLAAVRVVAAARLAVETGRRVSMSEVEG